MQPRRSFTTRVESLEPETDLGQDQLPLRDMTRIAVDLQGLTTTTGRGSLVVEILETLKPRGLNLTHHLRRKVSFLHAFLLGLHFSLLKQYCL